MAPPPQKTLAELQEDIRKLTERFNQNKISSTDYIKQLGDLESRLQFYYMDVDAPPVRDVDVFQKSGEVEEGIKLSPAKIEMADSLDEAAILRAEEQIRQRVTPQLYKSGEMGEPSPAFGLSRIVDPVKGLVYDTDTKQVRKATPSEFGIEALKRQIKYTPESYEPLGAGSLAQQLRKEAERDLVRLQNFRSMGAGESKALLQEYRRKIKEAERLEKEFAKDPQYRLVEATAMPESNLGWGFRMLMSGSAAVAPVVKETQDVISMMTGTPISTRKGAGYQKSQIDVPYLNQFLTNLATGQGVFHQMQAQLFPADTKNDGLLGFGTQGTFQSGVLSTFPEFAIPITPVGVLAKTAGVVGKGVRGTGKALKSRFLQKTGQFISEPVESILYHGHKAELDKALKSAQEGLSAKKIEKEIVKEGGLLSRQTLRAKTAETIGDIEGALKALGVAVRNAQQAGKRIITLDDIGVYNSTFLSNLIGDGMEVVTAAAKLDPSYLPMIRQASNIKNPSLRRATEIADETVANIMRGTKPTFDADVVSRSIRSAFLRNIDWDKIYAGALNVPLPPIKNVNDVINRTKELLTKSQTQGLKAFEIEGLGKSLKILDDYGLFARGQALKQSPKVVYEAVRNGVSSVLRDNFLKSIPDNYIDIGGTVAVPLTRIQTSTGRMTPAYKQHQKQKARLLESEVDLVGKELRYIPKQDAATSLLNYVRVSGLELPQNLLNKVEQASQGALRMVDGLTGYEYQALENLVSGELAIQFLDGVKLKAGTLTGELATLRGAARSTLIGPTQERGAAAIKLQGFVNALNHWKGQKGVFTKVYDKMFAKELLPVPLYRLQQQIKVAQQASFKQVTSRIEQNVQRATSSSGRVQAYNNTIEEYVQMDIAQQLGKAEGTATRQQMGIGPQVRQETVGQAEALKTIERQKLQAYKSGQQQKFDDFKTAQQTKLAEFLQQKEIEEVLQGFKTDDRMYKFIKDKQDQYNKLVNKKVKQIQKLQAEYKQKIQKAYIESRQARLNKVEKEALKQKQKIQEQYSQRKQQLQNVYIDKVKKLSFVQSNKNMTAAQLQTVESQNKGIQLLRDQAKQQLNESLSKLQTRYDNAIQSYNKKYEPLLKKEREAFAKKRMTAEQLKPLIERERKAKQKLETLKKQYQAKINQTEELYNKQITQKRNELGIALGKAQDKLQKSAAKKQTATKTRIAQREAKLEERITGKELRTKERIQKEELRQQEKSERISQQRRLSQLGEKFGRKNVNDFLKSQGIGDSYSDIQRVIGDLEQNMQVYTGSIVRAKLWENVIKKFFTKPVSKYVNPLRGIEDVSATIFRDVIRKDKNLPFYQGNNILAFTPDNVKLVVGRMKLSVPYLEDFGLKGSLRGADYNYPLIEMMNDVQRTENVNRAIKQFMIEQPDMLINLNRMNQGVTGLDNVESMALLLENEINMLLRFAINQGKTTQLSVDTLLDSIKEVLFDGVMKDVWTLSGRNKQRDFLNGYLGQMVKTGSTNVEMSQYLTNLVSDGLLKTNTFANIQNKSLRILARLRDKIKEPEYILKGFDSSALKTKALLDDAMNQLPEVIARLQKEYLLQLIGSANGNSTGLFGQQLMYLHGYMNRFGLSEDILLNNIRNMKPTLDYIGSTNMALLYGDVTGKLVPQLLSRFKESAFSEKLQKMATQYQGLASAGYNTLYALDYTFSQLRRLTTANMLYGIGLPTTRFLGFNRLTAPSIFLATIGYGGTSLKSALKFTGLSASMGLASLADRILVKRAGYKGMFDSTRYLHAPDDEIIIFANQTNAGRNYTARELRDLTDKYGIQYSRASIEFFDQEYKELLSIVGIRPDGSIKGVTGKVADVLNPTKSNYLARIAMVQDAELRQFVFIQSLKEGATIPQAADLAKRSMLDYTSLSSFERQYIARYIYFYAFMRTMGVETLNSFARAGSAPRILKTQNNLSQAMAQDVVGQTDDQRGRVFNLFAGSVDQKDIYLSGPPNPLLQMFDLMSTSALLSMNVATGERSDMVYEDVLFNAILSSGLKTAESNPLIDTTFEYVRAKAGGKRIRQFPVELIFAAEQQGMLDEVIQMYDLVPMDYVSPARPVTRGVDGEAGKYYTFRKGKAGQAGYIRYLKHRLMGMASFTMGVEHGMGGLIEPVDLPMMGMAAMTRNWRDFYKAQMLAAPRGIQVPRFDEAGEPIGQRTIPTTGRYLKGATIQKDLPIDVDFDISELREGLFLLYMSGIITPTKAKDKNRVLMRNLRDGLLKLEELEKTVE